MSSNVKNNKKKRIIIDSLECLKKILNNEDKTIEDLEHNEIIEECFKKENIKFKVIDSEDFHEYVKNLKDFEEKKNDLNNVLKDIKVLEIQRIEFDRDQSNNKAENYEADKQIESLAVKLYEDINEEEKRSLEEIELNIKEELLYAKDVELLKKIITFKNDNIIEKYDKDKSMKTVSIRLKEEIDFGFVKAEKGSVEYHKFLDSNVERMKRLTKNLKKYLLKVEENSYSLNQSSTIQDSINIALVFFAKKEFRAVSGKNDIQGCCPVKCKEESVFKSFKVNRLGQLGFGYERVNDSEKKILEEIHKEIKDGILKDEGKLELITRWEPCPSCYLVIDQFMKAHPKVNVKVKYMKRYGEV